MKIIIGCALLGAALGVFVGSLGWKSYAAMLRALFLSYVIIALIAAGTYLILSGL